MKSSKQKILLVALFISSGALGLLFSYYQHQKKFSQQVQTIQTFHYPAIFVEQLKGNKHAGKEIFTEFCAACHSSQPVIDITAPHIGDSQAWKFRRAMGMPALLAITIHGVAAMPARGGCFECSDAQLEQAIQYLLDHSK